MRTLPPLPPTMPVLRDPDFHRLQRQYPGLWSDPFEQPCITCRGERTFKSRQDGEIVEFECRCLDQWKLHLLLLHCGIGLNYQQASWDDLDRQVPGSVVNGVLAYSQDAHMYMPRGMGMILHGENGTGKTYLATLLLKDLIRAGYDGYFTQFNEMVDSYTRGWRDSEEEEWFIRRVVNAEVLVIDDIGKESKGRENVIGSLFDRVIRSRSAALKPTIITTNYTQEEVQTGYGGSVMSLLGGSSDFTEVTGGDFRLTKLKERMKADIRDGITRPVTLG